MKNATESKVYARINLAPAHTIAGMIERMLLTETETPSFANYNPEADLQAMRDMRQVLENRLKAPAAFGARGATSVAQILEAPNQFPEFKNYPKVIPKQVTGSLEAANGPDSVSQRAFLQHVQNAITAATESVNPPVAKLLNAEGWKAKPAEGLPDFGMRGAFSLGDVGGNVFFGLEPLPTTPPESNDEKGMSVLEKLRLYKAQAREAAAREKMPQPEWLHQLYEEMKQTLPSFAPIPGGARLAPRRSHGDGFRDAIPTHHAAPAHAPEPARGTRRSSGPHHQDAAAPQSRSTSAARPGEAPPYELPDELVEKVLMDLLNRRARLPPCGITGFDPRLSPAWPGWKLPGSAL